jgi:hypothetical protein
LNRASWETVPRICFPFARLNRENQLDDLMIFRTQRVRMKLPQFLQGVQQPRPRERGSPQDRPCVHEKGKRYDASAFAPIVEETDAQSIDLFKRIRF